MSLQFLLWIIDDPYLLFVVTLFVCVCACMQTLVLSILILLTAFLECYVHPCYLHILDYI